MTLLTRPLPRRLPDRVVPARQAPVLNATLVGRWDLTDSLAEFTLQLDSPLGPFLPGQYVSIGIAGDAGLIQRPYSVVSLDATRRRVELFVRRIPGGRLSSVLWQLPVGTRVRVGPARGLFGVDRGDQRRRVFVATGTGLAPFLAMLDGLDREGDTVETRLIHAASYADELAYGDRIDAWVLGGLPLDYRPTVSRPADPRNSTWRGRTGRAEVQLGESLAEGWLAPGSGVVYLCGNPQMIDACSALLERAGFPAADVRIEQFHAPGTGASA